MSQVSFESTTYVSGEEFARWVDTSARSGDPNHYEFLNGRIVMTPPAGWPHGVLGSALQSALFTHVNQRRLGLTCDSSQGFELPSGDVVEPDHAFVSTERFQAGPPPETGRFLKVVPDLIVETLSTSTASRDRGEKKAIYERNGVREYWLIDVRARTVTQFVLDGDRYGAPRLYAESERVESAVLPDLALRLADLLPA